MRPDQHVRSADRPLLFSSERRRRKRRGDATFRPRRSDCLGRNRALATVTAEQRNQEPEREAEAVEIARTSVRFGELLSADGQASDTTRASSGENDRSCDVSKKRL